MNKLKKLEESLKLKEEELKQKEKEIEAKLKFALDKEKEIMNKEKYLIEKEQYLNNLEKDLLKGKNNTTVNELKMSSITDYQANKLITDSSLIKSNIGKEYNLRSNELTQVNEKLESINKVNSNSEGIIGVTGVNGVNGISSNFLNNPSNLSSNLNSNLNSNLSSNYNPIINNPNSLNTKYTGLTNLNVEDYLQQLNNKTDFSTNPSTKSNLTPTGNENVNLKSFVGQGGISTNSNANTNTNTNTYYNTHPSTTNNISNIPNNIVNSSELLMPKDFNQFFTDNNNLTEGGEYSFKPSNYNINNLNMGNLNFQNHLNNNNNPNSNNISNPYNIPGNNFNFIQVNKVKTNNENPYLVQNISSNTTSTTTQNTKSSSKISSNVGKNNLGNFKVAESEASPVNSNKIKKNKAEVGFENTPIHSSRQPTNHNIMGGGINQRNRQAEKPEIAINTHTNEKASLSPHCITPVNNSNKITNSAKSNNKSRSILINQDKAKMSSAKDINALNKKYASMNPK